MTDTNPPTPQAEETPSTPGANRMDALLARLTGNRIPLSWARYGGIALLLVFALVIVALMRNFTAGMQTLRQDELRATAQALANAQIEAVTGGEASALMPALDQASSPFNLGIHRQTQPDTVIPSRARTDIQTYTVAQGDSLFAIAERFGIKAESILWFNYSVLQDNPNFVEIGQELNIPPTDGVLHAYRTGESIEAIVDQYSYSTEPLVEDVLDWPGNRMDPYETDPNNPGLADGTLLVVPNGSRELRDWGPPAISRDNPAVAAYYGPGACGAIGAGAIGTGTFVWPTTVRQLSGYDYNPPLHPGIDIAGAEGNSLFAVDGGVVVYAGWSNTGYGNLLVIDHGTGWQSAYAHMNSVAVTCGQNLSQGEFVGTLGNTGNSTGPHLHFELLSFTFGKVNPWNFLQ